MTTGYKIKDVADRSGFSASTLRYYEEIGLLPEADRTPAGYRLYDDRTLERLAFIARSKQLGCSLEEIADLALAWDGGECGPVRDRLRMVVADKLGSAQRQIVELMMLTSELQQAAAMLERHRPDGPCDDQCGCIADISTTGTSTSATAVVLSAKPTETGPIACTLGSASMLGRLEEWQALLAYTSRRVRIDNGVRATFAPETPLAEMIRLAAAEQDCCQFFNFAITIDARGIALEVTSPDDALPVLHSMFGFPT